jgi:hypothetical protein
MNKKEVYKKRISENLCVFCGKEKGNVNTVTCAECKEKYYKTPQHKQYCKNYAEKNKERRKQKTAKDRSDRIASCLCTQCGTKLESPDIFCHSCREKNRIRSRQKRCGYNFDKVMERDGYKCRICGRIYKLIIHHIDGHDEKDKFKNNSLDNLIVLCNSCHSSITKFRSNKKDGDLAAYLILA